MVFLKFISGHRLEYHFSLDDYSTLTFSANQQDSFTPYYDFVATIRPEGDSYDTAFFYSPNGRTSLLTEQLGIDPGDYVLYVDRETSEQHEGPFSEADGPYSVNDVLSFTFTSPSGAAPEPASWAMMIGGFGVAGGVLRRRKSATVGYA